MDSESGTEEEPGGRPRGLPGNGEDVREEEPGGRPGEWVSVREAAKRLGIDPKSIRNRIARNTLKWRHKGNQGREVWVEPENLPEGETEEDPGVDPRDLRIARLEERTAAQERLIASQERHIASLEGQIEWLRRPLWRRWLG